MMKLLLILKFRFSAFGAPPCKMFEKWQQRGPPSNARHQVFGFSWILKFEMHTGPFERFGPEPTWFQKFQVFLMQPCGLFQLLSCSDLAFPSPGISGYVAPWQVYGTSPVGQSRSKLSKYHGRGRMDTKQKAQNSSSVSRAGALVNPIFCTPDLERYTAR